MTQIRQVLCVYLHCGILVLRLPECLMQYLQHPWRIQAASLSRMHIASSVVQISKEVYPSLGQWIVCSYMFHLGGLCNPSVLQLLQEPFQWLQYATSMLVLHSPCSQGLMRFNCGYIKYPSKPGALCKCNHGSSLVIGKAVAPTTNATQHALKQRLVLKQE